MKKNNLLDIEGFETSNEEIFQPLAEGSAYIERIISQGFTTPNNEWYDQKSDEWVTLLQGEATILFNDNSEICLNSGDYILIPAHLKHRVTYSSTSPPCIWLAVHGNFSQQFLPENQKDEHILS